MKNKKSDTLTPKDRLAVALHTAWHSYIALFGEPPRGTEKQIRALVEFVPETLIIDYRQRGLGAVLAAAERRMPRRYCEWSEIEPSSGIYNTCEEGEEFHLTPGLDLYPYCQWCGGKIKVVELAVDGEANGT